jgi:hypothetical protein
VVVFLSINQVECEWKITFPEEAKGTYNSPGYMYFGKPLPFTISGNFSAPMDIYGCSPIDPQVAKGRIVVVLGGNCKDVEKAINVEDAGGIGLVVMEYAKNTLRVVFNEHQKRQVEIPCVASFIPPDQLPDFIAKLYQYSGNMVGIIDSEDWPSTNVGFWSFYTLFFYFVYLSNIFFSVDKLIIFKNNGENNKGDLPILVLSASILISVVNLVLDVDPGQTGRGVMPYAWYNSLYSAAWPLSMGCTLAVSFQWQEFVSKAMNKGTKSLFKLKGRPFIIGFWIVFAILFVYNTIIITLRGTYVTNNDVTLIFNTAIYMLCVLCVGVFFIYTGSRAYHELTKASATWGDKQMKEKRKKSLQRINIIRIICGVAWIGFLIMCVGITVSATSGPVQGNMTCQFLLFFFMAIVDTCHVHFFSPRRKVGSSSSGGIDNNTKSVESDSRFKSRQERTNTATDSSAIEMINTDSIEIAVTEKIKNDENE